MEKRGHKSLESLCNLEAPTTMITGVSPVYYARRPPTTHSHLHMHTSSTTHASELRPERDDER